MSDYKDGPYYRNDRNVRGTPFQWSMKRLEQPDGSVYGVKVNIHPRPSTVNTRSFSCLSHNSTRILLFSTSLVLTDCSQVAMLGERYEIVNSGAE